MNAIRNVKVELGECTLGGRPSKKEIVELWQQSNPGGTIDAKRILGYQKTLYQNGGLKKVLIRMKNMVI